MVNKLLQGNDLEYIRAAATTAMPDTVDIQRKTLTADKQGGYTEEWGNAYEGVPARLAAMSGAETTAAARQDLQPTATLTINYSQSIEQTDRVVHSSGTYEVQFIDAGQSWASAKRCQVRRL
jgi:SPP1 family predicted phage head-tail adaptor